MKRLLGKSGPLGVFVEYPALLHLGLICVFAEMAWATLLIVMEFYFKEELFVGQFGQSEQFVASKIAFAFLAFAGAETIFKYPMGALADKYGPRRFVILALAVCSVTPIAMWALGSVFKGQWWPFIPLRAVDGFAAAALWPAMSALMTRAVPRETRAAAMSVFNAAYCLGLAVGPMAGLYLGHVFKTNLLVFPFCAGLMAIGLVLALRFIPRTVRSADFHGENLDEERALLKGRPMLVKMMAIYALSQVGVGILAPTIPIYIDSQFGVKQADLPRLIALPALLIVLIAVPLGRLPDSIGRARAVWISYVLAAGGMICIASTSLFQAKDPSSLPAALFGFGMLAMVISYILGTPAWLGLTSLQVDDKKQAQALSLMQTAQGFGVVVAFALVASAGHLMTTADKVRARFRQEDVAQVIDVTRDAVPLSVWFWLSTAVFLICLVATLLFVRESGEHDDDQAAAEAPLEIKGF